MPGSDYLPASPAWPAHQAPAGHSTPPARATGVSALLQLADRLAGRLYSATSRLLNGAGEAPARQAAADCYAGRPEGREAVAALNRTLAVQPHNCLAWFQLGMVQLEQGALAEAVTAFGQAQSFGFETFELHYYRAEALSRLGHHEQAVDELYRALEKRPEAAEPAYRLGLSLLEIGRREEAVASLKIAISRAPKCVRYYQSLGLALEGLGRPDEALEYFKQAVKLEYGSGNNG